jgi:phage terminase large subunit-like protein
MYGISLEPDAVKKAREKARRRPDLRGEFARARFNIWTSSGTSLITPEDWAACYEQFNITDFRGMPCWMAVDLAQVLDMCAIVLLFDLGEKIAAFAKYFLPRESPTCIDPDMYDQFMAWEEQGFLTLTDGTLADHDRVREEVEMLYTIFTPKIIACDPAQAHNTVKHLWDGD